MSGERGDPISPKEKTVTINVKDNTKIKASDVIKNIEESLGEHSIVACIPKGGDIYEVTVIEPEAIDVLIETGLKVNNNTFKAEALYTREKVVSFMNVSHYVSDAVIERLLLEFGCQLKSEIRRKCHPDSTIENGIRTVRVRLPEGRTSLPYSMRIPTGKDSSEYVRVRHDNQAKKMCTKCFELNHTYLRCPENKCFKCAQFGHVARVCDVPPCEICRRNRAYCNCTPFAFAALRRQQIADDWGATGGGVDQRESQFDEDKSENGEVVTDRDVDSEVESNDSSVSTVVKAVENDPIFRSGTVGVSVDVHMEQNGDEERDQGEGQTDNTNVGADGDDIIGDNTQMDLIEQTEDGNQTDKQEKTSDDIEKEQKDKTQEITKNNVDIDFSQVPNLSFDQSLVEIDSESQLQSQSCPGETGKDISDEDMAANMNSQRESQKAGSKRRVRYDPVPNYKQCSKGSKVRKGDKDQSEEKKAHSLE